MAPKRATITSIAKHLNLDVSTVSRVLNGLAKKYRISEKTVKLVTNTANELNYTPNKIAKSLRLKKTFTIGLIVPDISNPWFAEIALRIEKESRKVGYNVFLCNSSDDINIEKESMNLLAEWKVDGVIMVPIGLEYDHLLDFYNNHIPLVLIDRFFENVEIPYVSTNDYSGAFDAIEHLIDNGHKNIACIQGVVGTSSNTQRVEGYENALKKHNIPLDENFILGDDFNFENGYAQTKQIIKNLNKTNITAIFSTSNQITLGALKAMKEENINIPDDISIISFDEHNYSDLLYIPISTVTHFDDNLGKKAIELLFNQIDNKTSTQENILLPTHLTKRESVKNRLAKVTK
ncbi:LacI family transcriptional regulator [Cellulophaga baltica]|uniref:LacI family DNA-binding transcriptional regulator n=1 Tax=Cellulophaga TaxID=104264 RepID=UPI001C079DB4|nr:MULTISPECIES: LacI family DNA-binding transcriptional regulator [Cellulophaga]MBU2996673.1 LacI family transcriptional regulator [Cellulophaga baltica]MDO6768067.1 LacI family DNA-binding transcriptional regulator [Cellulophaga sp. 1_MG-2023]